MRAPRSYSEGPALRTTCQAQQGHLAGDQGSATAGATASELAIGKFSIQITEAPAAVNADSIQALKDAGLNEGEILDLLHSDAIFA
ncbi:hypothetical protein [Achromobacter anxifer]